jgi:two-component system sensor histidine kinase/response regulator
MFLNLLPSVFLHPFHLNLNVHFHVRIACGNTTAGVAFKKNYLTLAILIATLGLSVTASGNIPSTEQHYLTNPIEGIQQSTAAYAAAMDHQDHLSAANALIHLGRYYYLQGDYNMAEDACSKSLTLYLKLNNRLGVTRAMIGLGDVFRKEKKYAQSIIFYRSAKQIAERWNLQLELCQANNRIGDIHRHQQVLGTAEHYYLRSLSIAKKNKYTIEIGNNYNNLAEIKRLEGKTALANDYYQQGLQMARLLENPFGIVENQYGLACIDTLQGKPDLALVRLTEARKLAERNRFRDELKNIYSLQAAIFESQGDLASSLQIQKEFNTLNEHLYLASVTLQNTQQRIINEIEQKNRELEEKTTTISKMSRMQIGLFIAVLLLLTGGAFLYNLNIQHKTDMAEIAKQSQLMAEAAIKGEQQRKELELSNDTRNRLLGLVSHDIRTPMYNSMQLLEVLLVHKVDTERMNTISTEVLAGLRITTQLIDNMLFWSKKNASQINAEFEIINLRNCLEEEMNLLSVVGKGKAITIQNNISAQINVYADNQLIRMTIRNLVMNSIKFTSKNGLITIDASRINGHTEVRVTDNGIGMTAQNMAHLFDEKSAFSSNGTQGETGTGLGLLMVKEFVSKNKGDIRVASEVGKGSTFSFTLKAV